MSCFSHCGFWHPSKSPRRLPRHRNAGVEIVLMQKGSVEWEVEGRVEVIRPGECFFTLPWQRHGGAHPVEPNAELVYVVIRTAEAYQKKPPLMQWPPLLGLDTSDTRRLHDRLTRRRRHALPASPRMQWLLPELARAVLARPEDLLARGLAVAALGELAEGLSRHDPRPFPEGSEAVVRAFIERLPAVCDQPWTLETMAAACGLKRTRFTELVELLTGDRPAWLLNRVRINRAAALLAAGQNVTEAAFATGFSSTQYFATVFRSFHQCKPSEWAGDRCRARTAH